MAWSLINRLSLLFSRSKPSRRLMTPGALPLPVELILMIMKLLDYKDMISVLQTCHAMKSIVETCIYAHIVVPYYDHLRMSRLLQTLHTRPELARNIITFDGSLYLAPRKSRFSRVVPRTSLGKSWFGQRSTKRHVSRATVAILHRMVNIKSLKLYELTWLGTESQTLVCNAICSTMSLTSLTIQGYGLFHSSRHPDSDSQLSAILRHQPLLERLELEGEWDLEQWILPTDVPHLTHLMSRPGEAKFFIPGRPIASLSLMEIRAAPDKDFWEALSTSASSIHTLKVNILKDGALLPVLQLLSTHLRDVQDLSLEGPYYENLPMLTAGFPSFLSVRTLHLTVWEHCCPIHKEEHINNLRTDLIARVQLECPQLESLEYGHFSRCGSNRLACQSFHTFV
ncbi:hypothetical protein FRB95_001222 [Tulasnella sp. JGI-2019a]|nr:hypothetical protein FRB95_001222 [Tulasnella sp. JGI-2019a]